LSFLRPDETRGVAADSNRQGWEMALRTFISLGGFYENTNRGRARGGLGMERNGTIAGSGEG